jgi:hypothetical protein
MKRILPIISVILGIVSVVEGVLTFTGIPIRGNLGKILSIPNECLFVSERCSGSFYLWIFVFISLIGAILGVISFKFKLDKIAGVLGIILSLIGLIIWLFIWILTIVSLVA